MGCGVGRTRSPWLRPPPLPPSPRLPPPSTSIIHYPWRHPHPSSFRRACGGMGSTLLPGNGDGDRGKHPRSPSPSFIGGGGSQPHALCLSPLALLHFLPSSFLHRALLHPLLFHLSPVFTSSGLGLRSVGARNLEAGPRQTPQEPFSNHSMLTGHFLVSSVHILFHPLLLS